MPSHRDNYLIIDTNVIIYAADRNLDLMKAVQSMSQPYTPVILDCVKKELKGLTNSVHLASIALELSERIASLESTGSGDDCIMDAAITHSAAVLTNDRTLARALKNIKIRTYSLRQGRLIG
jgi:rRNA-processing protein FCF1